MIKIPKMFQDQSGKVVIGQAPNAPLWIAIVITIIAKIPFIPGISYMSEWALLPVMLYWSYLEIFKGVNNFRRILGTIVGLYFIINALQMLKIV